MHWGDHPLPHFHARYGDYEIIVEIETGVVRGDFPKRALRAVLDWLDAHMNELLENWSLAAQRKPLKQITPLEYSMILHTEQIEPRDGYRLFVRFNNGVSGEIALENELWGEMFEPLRNPELFATAHQDSIMRTVVWSNGADFAPEFLMELLKKQSLLAA